MTITEFLLARITEDEAVALDAIADDMGQDGGFEDAYDRLIGKGPMGFRPAFGEAAARMIVWNTPHRVLAECAAKRAIIEEVSKWGHHYNDDDIWYSCGLATSWDDDEPGSGCSDESARGRCTCGLELRQLRILGPLAAVYAYDTDYRQEWALS